MTRWIALPATCLFVVLSWAEAPPPVPADSLPKDLSIDQVRAAVDYAVAALEICGSRVQDWDISFGDTVADNASSGAFVLGIHPRTLDEFEPSAVSMRMTVTGQDLSTGNGSATPWPACRHGPPGAISGPRRCCPRGRPS